MEGCGNALRQVTTSGSPLKLEKTGVRPRVHNFGNDGARIERPLGWSESWSMVWLQSSREALGRMTDVIWGEWALGPSF